MTNEELDFLVAEKVMGWKVQLHADGFEWSYPGTESTYFGNGIPNLARPDVAVPVVKIYDHDSSDTWSPSTDIAHAWEVVEHIKARWLFSRRQIFTDAIQELIGRQYAWPGALLLLNPKHICKAALIGAGVSPPP